MDKVVAVDLDGTLGDHYQHMVNFSELWMGRKINYEPSAGWPPGATKFQFNRAMGISKESYRKIKLAYRLGGMKRSMPVYPGAQELMRGIRKAGAQIWICTARPYLKMDIIDPDTRHWLKINRIPYDNLLYGEYKYRDLVKQVNRKNVVAVLDDVTEMYQQAEEQGLQAILIERPHNQDRPAWPHFNSVSNLDEAYEEILEMIYAFG
jgi:FMN phosphatase YigB (HAD superfamily)